MMWYPCNSIAGLKVHWRIQFIMYCWTQCPIIIIRCYREQHRMQSWSSLKYHPSTLPIFSYLLHRTVLLEKLTNSQLVKKFPAFYGTQRFITTFASARHLPCPEQHITQRQNGMDTFGMSKGNTAAFHRGQEVDLNSTCRWSTNSRCLCHAKHCKVINKINRFTEISIAWLGFMQIIKAIKTHRSCPIFFNTTGILSTLWVGFNQNHNVIHKWWHQNHFPSN